jgi:predicted nuclease of restriction endonuclease-like (RecB) superfamily
MAKRKNKETGLVVNTTNENARLYYAQDAAQHGYSAKELRWQISRKAYERREIANAELSKDSTIPFNVFKDPYLLDIFGLRDNYLEMAR